MRVSPEKSISQPPNLDISTGAEQREVTKIINEAIDEVTSGLPPMMKPFPGFEPNHELEAVLQQFERLQLTLTTINNSLADVVITLANLQSRVEKLEARPLGSRLQELNKDRSNCPTCHRLIRTSNGVCGHCGWRP